MTKYSPQTFFLQPVNGKETQTSVDFFFSFLWPSSGLCTCTWSINTFMLHAKIYIYSAGNSTKQLKSSIFSLFFFFFSLIGNMSLVPHTNQKRTEGMLRSNGVVFAGIFWFRNGTEVSYFRGLWGYCNLDYYNIEG